MKVTLLIPTLNEAQNLPLVIPQIPHLPEILEVLLVDGHSTDDTTIVARQLMPDIRVVVQDGRGKGDALICGALAAAGDYILVLDADTSHRPEEIPLYIAKAAAGYDLVKGSRYAPGGRSEDSTWFRDLVIRTANLVANIAWGSHFSDICYGMFMINREMLLSLDLTAKSWDVEWQMMVRAKSRGLAICEVPAFERRRTWGKSKLPNYAVNGWTIASRVFREAITARRAW